MNKIQTLQKKLRHSKDEKMKKEIRKKIDILTKDKTVRK